MSGKFEISRGKNGEFYFNLKASNGQVVLSSEGYKAKRSCINGAESVRRNSAVAERFVSKKSKNGKAYFTLLASNGQVIGKSQMYDADAGCSNGIRSVQSSAANAKISDLTAA